MRPSGERLLPNSPGDALAKSVPEQPRTLRECRRGWNRRKTTNPSAKCPSVSCTLAPLPSLGTDCERWHAHSIHAIQGNLQGGYAHSQSCGEITGPRNVGVWFACILPVSTSRPSLVLTVESGTHGSHRSASSSSSRLERAALVLLRLRLIEIFHEGVRRTAVLLIYRVRYLLLRRTAGWVRGLGENAQIPPRNLEVRAVT